VKDPKPSELTMSRLKER